MSEKTIVIDLDSKRLLVLVVILAVSVFSIYGYITALFAFIAPSEEFPLDVTSVGTFDTGDSSKTSFPRGDTVRIKATVEMATGYYYNYVPSYYYYYDFVGTISYRIIVAVRDGDGAPFFFTYQIRNISPGDIQVTSYDYTIPFTASKENYTIRVMVWSDWLPDGDALATAAGEATFEVT